MMGFQISKWQRLILAIGAMAFFVGALAIFLDDYSERSPTVPFLVAIVLAVLTLTPARPDEEALPFLNLVRANWRKITKYLFAATLAIGVIAIVLSYNADGRREAAWNANYTATEPATAENVELPAEEATNWPGTLVSTPTATPETIATAEVPDPAKRDARPLKVGDCVRTAIKEISSRLEGVPDSGSAVEYENGLYGVDYEVIEAISESRAGDPIKLCLISMPQDCPTGDDRGKVYSATNIRTKGNWSLPDSSHMCGGA